MRRLVGLVALVFLIGCGGTATPLATSAVLAVYSIRCDSLAVQAHECQDLAADGVNGQHRHLDNV